MSGLTQSEREELLDLRAVYGEDVCSPRLNAEIALSAYEKDLAVVDLMNEVLAMRRGVGVSYARTADPLDYNAEPIRRLWPLKPEDRQSLLGIIARCKAFIEKHKDEPAGNPNRAVHVELPQSARVTDPAADPPGRADQA